MYIFYMVFTILTLKTALAHLKEQYLPHGGYWALTIVVVVVVAVVKGGGDCGDGGGDDVMVVAVQPKKSSLHRMTS